MGFRSDIPSGPDGYFLHAKIVRQDGDEIFWGAMGMPTDVHYSIGVTMKFREAHASNTQKTSTYTARHMDAIHDMMI